MLVEILTSRKNNIEKKLGGNMFIELDLTPDMFYDNFGFYEGVAQLEFPFIYQEELIMNIWGVDIFLGKEVIKNQLSKDIIKELRSKFRLDEILDNENDLFFVNGISKLIFYEVDEISMKLELLHDDSAERIKDINNNKVILEYKREEKVKNTVRKKFEFPGASIYFPYSWMYGNIYSAKDAKLIINIEDIITIRDYTRNVKEISANFRKNYQETNFFYRG